MSDVSWQIETEILEGGDLAPVKSESALELDVAAIKKDILDMNDKVSGVSKFLADYEITDEALKALASAEIKDHATSLNKYFEGYETARKSLKSHLTEPYKVIESKGKELIKPVVDIRDRYKVAFAEREEEERALRREGIERTYKDYAPALVGVVPFERILNPKWLNKSFGAVKACEEMEQIVARIARDWEAFRKLDLAFKDEAEAVFFRELSLQAAIEFNDLRMEEQARLDALKYEVALNRGEAEAVPVVEPEIETLDHQQDIVAEAEQYVASVASAEFKPVSVYVLAIDATAEQKASAVDYLRSVGIHGRAAKSGFTCADEAMECMKGVLEHG